MSKQDFQWDRAKRRERINQDNHPTEGVVLSGKLANSVRNNNDKCLVRELLAYQDLTEGTIKYWNRWLDWLGEIPTRTLYPNVRTNLIRQITVASHKAKGTYTKPTEEQRAAAKKRQRLKDIRIHEAIERRRLPAWMNDHTQLPTKPPKARE